MKLNNANAARANYVQAQEKQPTKRNRCRKILVLTALTGALCWTQTAGALTVTPVSHGLLANGKIIDVVLITLEPGDTVPWHYHSGPGWGTIISGTLTEDEGCGTALNVYPAGTAFSEIPGKVHRVFNYGTGQAMFSWVEIYPACDTHQGTIFVNGPRCLGNSGRSRLEPIPDCDDADHNGNAAPPRPGGTDEKSQEQSAASQSEATKSTASVTAPAVANKGIAAVAIQTESKKTARMN